MNVRLFLMLVQFAISSLFSFRFPLESNRKNFKNCLTENKGIAGWRQILLKTPNVKSGITGTIISSHNFRQGISKHLGVNFKNMVTTWN